MRLREKATVTDDRSACPRAFQCDPMQRSDGCGGNASGKVGAGRAWAVFIHIPGFRGGLGSAFDLGGIGGKFAAETSFTGGWRRGHLVLGPAVLAQPAIARCSRLLRLMDVALGLELEAGDICR